MISNTLFRAGVSASMFAAFTAASAANPTTFKVAGLGIGQSEQEAKSAFVAFTPKLATQRVMWREELGVPGALAALGGTNAPRPIPLVFGDSSNGVTDYLYAGFGQTTGTAYLVALSVAGASSNKLQSEKLADDLVTKYGAPTAKELMPGTGIIKLSWTYKKDGSPASGSVQCRVVDLDQQYFNQFQNVRPDENCGISAQATIWPQMNSKLVRAYQVGVYDHQAHLRDVKAIMAARDAAQKQKDDRDRAGATGKSKI